ncbi:hypothetical protein [uncultured Desulfobacter sp.]|nr:hypothetical protein [uncultured Desulfobacter sp.]
MATVDKNSVRAEIDHLKQDFEKLCAEGKVSAEMRALMNSMLLIVELILSIFLEKKTRKDNKNSSLPSSQTPKDETSKSSSGSKGKGKEVSGKLSNARTKSTVTIAQAVTCDVCGQSLDQTPCLEYE